MTKYNYLFEEIEEDFWSGHVRFTYINITTEYNKEDDKTYFTARLNIENWREEIIEGSVSGDDKEGAELSAIIDGTIYINRLYKENKMVIKIKDINNTKLREIRTNDFYIRKIAPKNTVLDWRQRTLMSFVRNNKNLKIRTL